MLPSEADETDLEEDKVEASEGVENDLSSGGHAPKAKEGVILGDGEDDLRRGEFALLNGGVMSAMFEMASF